MLNKWLWIELNWIQVIRRVGPMLTSYAEPLFSRYCGRWQRWLVCPQSSDRIKQEIAGAQWKQEEETVSILTLVILNRKNKVLWQLHTLDWTNLRVIVVVLFTMEWILLQQAFTVVTWIIYSTLEYHIVQYHIKCFSTEIWRNLYKKTMRVCQWFYVQSNVCAPSIKSPTSIIS